MQLTTGTKLGAFEITGLLGKGGMGEVYRARDTKLDREVAIKVLPEDVGGDPERLARFRPEVRFSFDVSPLAVFVRGHHY